jgi:Ca-activated chloride channel family protein
MLIIPGMARSSPPRLHRDGSVATLLASLAAILGLLPSPGLAQPTAELPSFGGEVSVGLVLVPVVVRSGDGYVRGLDPQDFRLLVDGEAVPFESFERRDDAPISVVFLQDLSGSMEAGGKLAASREGISYFLDQATPADEFAIATFAGPTTAVEVPFTNDLSALRESIATWEAYGKTALHDAVSLLPEISGGGSHAKRAAVLVTDGADNASALPPEEAREIVRRAQVPVYVLGLGAGNPYELAREGGKANRYADVLNLLALYTAGRYFPVEGPDDLKEAVVAIAEDLRHQYVLGFATAGNGRPRQHRIQVEVPERPFKVLARQGYHGNQPAVSRVGN